MPIYDFKCRGCGKVSEMLVRGGNDEAIAWPDRGGRHMQIVVRDELADAWRKLAGDSHLLGTTGLD